MNAAGACILPAADLTYVATRWDGVTEPFGRAFLPGFAALALCGLIARGLGAGQPIGATLSRQAASDAE